MSLFTDVVKYGPELLYRRFTAGSRVFPNMFILGAPKSGTSSLSKYLHMHPSYLPGYTKELMFLQKFESFSFKSNWEYHAVVRFLWQKDNGDLKRYLKFFPTKAEFEKVRQSTGKAYTGDHTPFYLYSRESLELIKKHSPDAKLVILLRDPVLRTYSDYNMHRRRDPTEKRTFEVALKDEMEGREADFRKNYLYQSTYAPHVKLVKAMFPAGNIMITPAEKFFADPHQTWEKLLKFLQLPSLPPASLPADAFLTYNKGKYDNLKLKEETELLLRKYFKPHNEKLYDILDEDMGWDAVKARPVAQHV